VFVADTTATKYLPDCPAAKASLPNDDHRRTTGRLLVWDRYDAATHSAALIVGFPDGSHQRQLTHPAPGVFDTESVRSPDGRRVIFNRESPDGTVAIGIATVRNGAVRLVDTHCVDPCVDDINPGWTPDGHHITFDRVSGPFDPVTGDAASALLYTEREDGSHPQRLSEPGNDGTAEDTDARFAPDGRYLVFVRDQRINGDLHFAIFRMNPDGTHVQQLTPWDLEADRPSVSPARTGASAGWISFETHGGATPTQGDIARLPASCKSLTACTNAIRLVTHNTGTTNSSYAATWSPNGDRLAFALQDNTGNVDIWTARSDGHDRSQVTHSPAPEYSPAWSQ